MIKRRFYKHEHDDKDVPSDSDSSSDSELEAKSTEEESEEEDVAAAEVRQNDGHCSSSSGYESEDSSAHEVDIDSTGLPKNEDDLEIEEEQSVSQNHSIDKRNSAIVEEQLIAKADKDEIPSDVPGCVLKTKSVFKCKLCPRIVCLTEETLKTHLNSKRHARSEKLFNEGRLKLMLNSDGELETGFEEEETHQERHASTLAAAEACQNAAKNRKKNKGRQRQRKRRVKKKIEDLTSEGTESTRRPPKKRRKSNT